MHGPIYITIDGARVEWVIDPRVLIMKATSLLWPRFLVVSLKMIIARQCTFVRQGGDGGSIDR